MTENAELPLITEKNEIHDRTPPKLNADPIERTEPVDPMERIDPEERDVRAMHPSCRANGMVSTGRL